MNKKTIGTVLLVAGVILLLASLTADMIGIGEAASAFGYKQIIGTVVGAVAAVAGFFLRSKE
jgi:asparagine N-glycosylation enzyme membrane subunit Stt3